MKRLKINETGKNYLMKWLKLNKTGKILFIVILMETLFYWLFIKESHLFTYFGLPNRRTDPNKHTGTKNMPTISKAKKLEPN